VPLTDCCNWCELFRCNNSSNNFSQRSGHCLVQFSLEVAKSGGTLTNNMGKFFLRILNYVLAGRLGTLNLNVFSGFYLCVVKKPLRKLLALVRVARETLRFCIPFVAFAAGNFRILAHGNQKYILQKGNLLLMKQ
jgi:hypothetical protein